MVPMPGHLWKSHLVEVTNLIPFEILSSIEMGRRPESISTGSGEGIRLGDCEHEV